MWALSLNKMGNNFSTSAGRWKPLFHHESTIAKTALYPLAVPGISICNLEEGMNARFALREQLRCQERVRGQCTAGKRVGSLIQAAALAPPQTEETPHHRGILISSWSWFWWGLAHLSAQVSCLLWPTPPCPACSPWPVCQSVSGSLPGT